MAQALGALDVLTFAGEAVARGQRRRVSIPISRLFDHTRLALPVEVVRGTKDGPTLFVSAAIHGDELNGVEVIKRLLANRRINTRLYGTLIAVPVVNVFGYNASSRYLPDRRDLNRCFPGSAHGSLAAQTAHVFMREIVDKATHGIDLHTAAIHRTNLPQIRACLENAETMRLAEAFGVPVVLNSDLRDGSLRQSAVEKGIPMLLFEGGEALRHEESVIRAALHGILRVMQTIGMLPEQKNKTRKQPRQKTFVARSSHWLRAPHSGSLRAFRHIGDRVKKGELLGVLSDPYGYETIEVRANKSGIIIGMIMMPLVNDGDAMFHIATFEDARAVEEHLEALQVDHEKATTDVV